LLQALSPITFTSQHQSLKLITRIPINEVYIAILCVTENLQ